jgi:hypothetical protein
MLELLFKDFLEHVFNESEVFFSRQQGKFPCLLCSSSYLFYSSYKLHDRSKLSCTYARTTRTYLTIPWKPRRLEWLGYFCVEMLNPTRSGLGLGRVIVPYFILLSPSMLVLCFPVSLKNRDLG